MLTLTTHDLMEELNRRGFICIPKTTMHPQWSRMSVASIEAFRWEALHMIIGRLTPDHLHISTRPALGDDPKSEGSIITTATLYLY